MPQMKARVRVLVEIPLDAEVSELEHEPVREGERAGLRATNEDKVLEARAKAAHEAEDAARHLYSDALEVLVEEVFDA